ncbi:MAG: hypothetical protein QGH45_12925 [Myxococcota bacterium]|nr:hypothetical protein [Myxococcota bacterium]
MARTRIPAALLWLAITLATAGGCGSGAGDPGSSTPSPGEYVLRWELAPFFWTASVPDFDPGTDLHPGGSWSLAYDLELDLRAYEERYGEFTELIVAVGGEWRYDRDGAYRSASRSNAISSNLTPTGLPIEYFGGWPKVGLLHGAEGSPFEAFQVFAADTIAPLARIHQLSGELTVELPADAPEGYYQPRIYVFVRVDGEATPIHLAAFADNWNEKPYPVLPLVRVGRPATPRLPWSILAAAAQMGRTGTLPVEDRERMALAGRAGFGGELILRPGRYPVAPSFPTLFPQSAIAAVDGGLEVVPDRIPSYLDLSRGGVSCRVKLPDGSLQDLGTRRFLGEGPTGPTLDEGPFDVSFAATGRYEIELTGYVLDGHGRRFEGGGTYEVHVAHPLTFSTSCKPGNPFLVGDAYPSKVNVNPPFPAEVTVEVVYLPDSDPARRVDWVGSGSANRFGHFVDYATPPLRFEEPGEYRSTVSARFVDGAGELWMGQQVSASVIAPDHGPLRLHGTRSFPYGLRVADDYNGGLARISERQDMKSSFLPFTPAMLPDPYVPADPRDTLFVPTHAFHDSLVEPHFSMALSDPELSETLQGAYSQPLFSVPPMYQRISGDWLYLRDVVQLSTDSGGWFPADEGHADELPILPVGGGAQWHPFTFPERNRFEAYTYMGIVRPGFPAMTTVYQRDAIGMYWLTSPNRYGFHYNTGSNADLPGDLYRVLAGAVVKDLESGRNLYDAYSAAIAVSAPTGSTLAILGPGERPLVTAAGREHSLFLALDSHDTLEVGERIGLGGMVFPAVEADVTWTVTTPDGRLIPLETTADRLGIARAPAAIPVDGPGLYRVQVEVRHGELTGDVVGTADGSWWHCAVEPGAPPLLYSELPARTTIDPLDGIRIPLAWPADLTDVHLHWGVIMPGQLLDQGEVSPARPTWEYPFEPAQLAVAFPNLDVRSFASGEWELSDTVVFQFFLEAKRGGEPVFDALRLVLRDDLLVNQAALMRASGRE